MYRRINTMTSHQFDRGKFERSLLAMLRVDRCIPYLDLETTTLTLSLPVTRWAADSGYKL